MLAIEGGKPVRKEPFPPWPYYASDELEAVNRVLASGRVNYWTGEEGRNFEKEFAAYIRSGYALALANGSLALDLALKVLGIGPGDEVIVPACTFVATAGSVVLCGARPVFADINPENLNISCTGIRKKLSAKTRAVIVVHLAGWPCVMQPILDLAEEYGLKIIEDCAQASGSYVYPEIDLPGEKKSGPNAETRDALPDPAYKHVGTFGHIGCFSFCQDKNISSGGEGGMLVTADASLWEKAWSYKDHGKNFQAMSAPDQDQGYRWVHDSFGTNYRLTEMQAAIGRRQLTKLAAWVRTRRRNAAALQQGLANIKGIKAPWPEENVYHSFYRYICFFRPEMLRPEWDQTRIIQAVQAEGIPCMAGFCPEVYREKAFRDKGLQPEERLPVAKNAGETSLMFLVHPTLGQTEMQDSIQAVKKVMDKAGK